MKKYSFVALALLLSIFRASAQEVLPPTKIDRTFRPTLDGNVMTMVIDPDDKIVVGGAFHNGGFSDEEALRMDCIMRLNKDGSPDKTFNKGGSGFNNLVYAITRTKEGKYLVAGAFTEYNGAPVGMLVRLNSDGSLDPTFKQDNKFVLQHFNENYTTEVNKIMVHPSGSIYVAGAFNTVNGIFAPLVARFSADGEHDASYQPVDAVNEKSSPIILGSYMEEDGSFYITGFFSKYGAIRGLNGIARFNEDGSLDKDFLHIAAKDDTDYSCTIKSIAPYDKGRYIIAGDFTKINGNPRFLSCVINSKGEVEMDHYQPYNFASLNPSANWACYSALRYGEYVFVGGGDVALAKTSYLRALTAQGKEIREGYDFGLTPDGTVAFLQIDPRGWLYISGLFKNMSGTPTLYFTRAAIPAQGTAIAPISPLERVAISQIGLSVKVEMKKNMAQLSLYSVDGVLVAQQDGHGTEASISAPEVGNYILCITLEDGSRQTGKVSIVE